MVAVAKRPGPTANAGKDPTQVMTMRVPESDIELADALVGPLTEALGLNLSRVDVIRHAIRIGLRQAAKRCGVANKPRK